MKPSLDVVRDRLNKAKCGLFTTPKSSDEILECFSNPEERALASIVLGMTWNWAMEAAIEQTRKEMPREITSPSDDILDPNFNHIEFERAVYYLYGRFQELKCWQLGPVDDASFQTFAGLENYMQTKHGNKIRIWCLPVDDDEEALVINLHFDKTHFILETEEIGYNSYECSTQEEIIKTALKLFTDMAQGVKLQTP